MRRRPYLYLLPLWLLVILWPQGGLGDYLRLVAMQSTPLIIGALAMMLIGAMRGVDLGAGAQVWLAATGVVVAPWGAGVALAFGAAIGALNARLLRAVGGQMAVVTFATGLAWLALAQFLPAATGVPEWLRKMMDPTGWSGALAFWLALAVAGGLASLLRYTVWGRHLLAAGSNEEAAQLCGIRTRQIRSITLMLAGALLALAGWFAVAGRGEVDLALAPGLTLDLLAAALLGGGSFNGGRAPVGGVVAGAISVVLVRHAVVLMGGERPVADLALAALVACLWVMRTRESAREE